MNKISKIYGINFNIRELKYVPIDLFFMRHRAYYAHMLFQKNNKNKQEHHFPNILVHRRFGKLTVYNTKGKYRTTGEHHPDFNDNSMKATITMR